MCAAHTVAGETVTIKYDSQSARPSLVEKALAKRILEIDSNLKHVCEAYQ